MNVRRQHIKNRKIYVTPCVEKIAIDQEISFVMMSNEPPGDPSKNRPYDRPEGPPDDPFSSPFR